MGKSNPGFRIDHLIAAALLFAMAAIAFILSALSIDCAVSTCMTPVSNFNLSTAIG